MPNIVLITICAVKSPRRCDWLLDDLMKAASMVNHVPSPGTWLTPTGFWGEVLTSNQLIWSGARAQVCTPPCSLPMNPRLLVRSPTYKLKKCWLREDLRRKKMLNSTIIYFYDAKKPFYKMPNIMHLTLTFIMQNMEEIQTPKKIVNYFQRFANYYTLLFCLEF